MSIIVLKIGALNLGGSIRVRIFLLFKSNYHCKNYNATFAATSLQPTNQMKKFEELKALIATLEDDVNKFYNNKNGAAGTRLRKAMQDLKAIAQGIRTEVQELKNKESK